MGLFFCGYGAVARTLLTLMLREENWLLDLPVIIIENTDSPENETIYNVFGKWNKISESDNLYTSTNRNALWINEKITEESYQYLFNLGKNIQEINCGIMIELAYRLETYDLINWCVKNNFMYINTAIDKWQLDHSKSIAELKDKILRHTHNTKNYTVLLNHGMNPGLISHMVKELLVILNNTTHTENTNYAELAKNIGLEVIQISERDTQISKTVRTTRKLYTNTWSVVGLLDELFDPVQIAWGSHEKTLPHDVVKYVNGQIILERTADKVTSESYEPNGGELRGYAIPHAETYSLYNMLKTDTYNPTIYYSYDVPEGAKEIIRIGESNLNDEGLPEKTYVLKSKDIDSGFDSVGCLFVCKDGTTHWMGTILDNETAKTLSLEVNATTIQVGISLLAAIIWMINNPFSGIIEPENVDTTFILGYAKIKKWLGAFYPLVNTPYRVNNTQFIKKN